MDLKNTYTQKQQQKKRKRLTYHKTLREVMIKEVCPTVPVHKNLSMLMQIVWKAKSAKTFTSMVDFSHEMKSASWDIL